MTDITFLEIANKKCTFSECTLLEYNALHCLMLCHAPWCDGLFLYQYDEHRSDDHDLGWQLLRGEPNTNEGFQYMMDLYQLFIATPLSHKKR